MENFIVSARKYRPATFKSVVGQKSVTETLKNAIKSSHLAQSYLFCGPRGIGKTTCARIFAKTLNCQNLSKETEACNTCDSCQSFNTSRSYNIHELDAASNNSVDDIRNLIDQVRIPPQTGKYSIYIIDEVHMLSSSAFNAFLKTLEEPPPHAVFILATTEKHKIIPTILSRCQIFDFKRISVKDIIGYLQFVAEQEKVNAATEAMSIIAQKSDGSMRDALSIFDQLVSFSDGEITYANTIENLNVLDYEYYFKLADYFLQNDVSKALLIFNEILQKGFDAHYFINGLAGHFRDIMVCKDKATIQLLEVGDDIKKHYARQADDCPQQFLYKALDIANQCDLNYKGSQNKRLLVELMLVKLSQITAVVEESKEITFEKKKPIEKFPSKLKPEIKVPELSENVKDEAEKTPVKSQKKSEQEEKKADDAEPDQSSDISIISITRKETVYPEEKEKPEDKDIVEEPPVELSQNKPFTPQDVLAKMQQFVKKEHISKRKAATLLAYEPQLKDENQIIIRIDNSLQKEEIVSIKPELLGYLKSELQNSMIDLKTEINKEKSNGPKKLYEDKDKFEYMNHKNPNLTKLRQKFSLDFE